jgi:hypothetical protein
MGDWDFIQKKLLGMVIITPRIIWWDQAFIPPKDMHGGPWDLGLVWRLGQQGE